MKHLLSAMSLSLILSTFSLPAVAQEIGERSPQRAGSGLGGPVLTVSQATTLQQQNAFDNSKYTFWDANVLAEFWHQGVSETKASIGQKLLWGGSNITDLDRLLQDARNQAMGQVRQLRFFSQTYTFNDAAALARFWGEPTPFDAKLRIERKLIMGDAQVVDDSLRQANRPIAPPCRPTFWAIW